MVNSATHNSGMLQASQGGIGQTLALPMLNKDTNPGHPPLSAKHGTVLSPVICVYEGKVRNDGFAFDSSKELIGGECISGAAISSEVDWKSFLSVTALEEQLVAQAGGISPGSRLGKSG